MTISVCSYIYSKQKHSQHFPKAETQAITFTVKKALFIKIILEYLCSKKRIKIILLSDTTNVVEICKHSTKQNSTKHFYVDVTCTRDHIKMSALD